MLFRALLLTDLDNTIYNWIDYFAPSFRAMVHVLSRETGLSESVIIEDFKRVFSRHKSVEYAFSIQELCLCRDRSPAEVLELIRLAKGAFSRVREKRLRAYPGVKEALSWARDEGIAIVGVTNAPIFQAQRRLYQLGLDSLFTGLAAWEGFGIPEEDPFAEPIKVRKETRGWKTNIEKIWRLASDGLKPNPEHYRIVIEDLGIRSSDTWVVGDSLQKDVRPALQIGAKGVWARYGQQFEQKNFRTILSVTHWSAEKIAETYDPRELKPDLVIDRFDDLVKHIPSVQAALPWFERAESR